MPEILEKLRPDRDLQCYFERPSAIAAISSAGPHEYRVTGTWRQQFDWAVIEWNQHNVFEHPLFRNLPDGDLSGLILEYEETRENCLAMDSDVFPTVDWPYLRIWTRENGVEDFYRVSLIRNATPVDGAFTPASAELELLGILTPGDYVGISCLDEHHTYQVSGADTLESVIQALADSVNTFSRRFAATRHGRRIQVSYVSRDTPSELHPPGANGNWLGMYGFVSGARTEFWLPEVGQFSGGGSPTKWSVRLDFSNLTAVDGRRVPTTNVRKMRWTYAADLQRSAFVRSEFEVQISNWSVTGERRAYLVAGPGSRRLEDGHRNLVYSGEWETGRGNFSGGTIRYTTSPGASIRFSYSSPSPHRLYLGTRLAFNGTSARIEVDSVVLGEENLHIPGEDTLARVLIGEYGPGAHTVRITHAGAPGSYLYFDFLELAVPTAGLPEIPPDSTITLATDWDTDHSIAIAPERTAWMISSLGFHGLANHYVGALWFYELTRTGHAYASVDVDFLGTPQFSALTQLTIGRVGESSTLTLNHVNRIGDTAATVAKAFELELNRAYTAIWAEATGTRLTIYARAMGEAGNAITISASPNSGPFQVLVASPTLTGGADGVWHTDLAAVPRLNRAVRDWSRAFYAAMRARGIDVAAAFSMELQHGDPAPAAGIAQRYYNGEPVLLNTPALQTNFSPQSLAFWREVYREMAALQIEAGLPPLLQFGEVQWWYFAKQGTGMTFYDDYTRQRFLAEYGRPLPYIDPSLADPSPFLEELRFLARLIGEFTDAVMNYVRSSFPQCDFEVLYPTDVNESPVNRLLNFPGLHWTPASLKYLKTESFTYTYLRDLNAARFTVEFPSLNGFPPSQRSFLVGISDPTQPWRREVEMALGHGVASVVLFALDQFCLVGHRHPRGSAGRRSLQMG